SARFLRCSPVRPNVSRSVEAARKPMAVASDMRFAPVLAADLRSTFLASGSLLGAAATTTRVSITVMPVRDGDAAGQRKRGVLVKPGAIPAGRRTRCDILPSLNRHARKGEIAGESPGGAR